VNTDRRTRRERDGKKKDKTQKMHLGRSSLEEKANERNFTAFHRFDSPWLRNISKSLLQRLPFALFVCTILLGVLGPIYAPLTVGSYFLFLHVIWTYSSVRTGWNVRVAAQAVREHAQVGDWEDKWQRERLVTLCTDDLTSLSVSEPEEQGEGDSDDQDTVFSTIDNSYRYQPYLDSSEGGSEAGSECSWQPTVYGECAKPASLPPPFHITLETPNDDPNTDFSKVMHLILIPNYKETMETLAETLSVLASHNHARRQYRVTYNAIHFSAFFPQPNPPALW
jgi:hypothetical protein